MKTAVSPHPLGRCRPTLARLSVFLISLPAWLAAARADEAPWPKVFTPTYTLTDVGGSEGTNPYSGGTAINALGDAVGYLGNNAFLYHRGTLINLGAWLPANSAFSSASSINLEGQVVGGFRSFSPAAGFQATGFLYSNGRIQTFTGPNGESTAPDGINNFGQVVGTLQQLGPMGVGASDVFLRQPSGQITDLGTFGGTYAYGQAINDLG
jgi:hypothetical protein